MTVDSLVGRSFAGYRIERPLGRGGMSVVYLAQHPRLKSAVALKLLAPGLASDAGFRERLLRESQLAASLNHPNVIPIFDTGEEDGTVFIAMRYVDGPDLHARLRERKLSLDELASLMEQVAAALDAAHARGLVHRDVKPANVLIEEGGTPPGHVYVADFGLTKQLDARTGATASGQFIGTVDYMSPEQIQGRTVDARTDVYALGCVLYECLTGQPPFRRDSDVAVIWAQMRDEPAPPTDLDRQLPRSMDAVIARALAKDPDDRYASCGELAADVRVAVGDRRRRSASVTRLARLRRRRVRVRRRWLRPALAGALIGAAVAAGIALAVRPSSPAAPSTLTQGDQSLLQLVPVPLRSSCTHAPPPTPDFSASVVCTPSGAPIQSVTYSVPRSASRMRANLLGDVYRTGVGRPGVAVSPSGHCGTSAVAVRDWGETASGRRLEKAKGMKLKTLGRLLCFTRNDWSAAEWTDTRVDVYSVVYGRTPAAVYRWWATKAGPLSEPTS
jgi:serine/threonine protein kinase